MHFKNGMKILSSSILGFLEGYKDNEELYTDFVVQLIFLLSNFISCNHTVKCNLIKRQCMAFYECVLLDLSFQDADQL